MGSGWGWVKGTGDAGLEIGASRTLWRKEELVGNGRVRAVRAEARHGVWGAFTCDGCWRWHVRGTLAITMGYLGGQHG